MTRLRLLAAQTLTPTWPQQVEMVIQQWRAVGIAADLKLLERSLFFTRVRNDQHLAVDGVWTIGLVGLSPSYMGTRVVSLKLENVPERVCTSQHCRTPWSARPDQWYFKP